MVDAAPPVAQLDHWLTQRRRHAQLAAAVAALTERRGDESSWPPRWRSTTIGRPASVATRCSSGPAPPVSSTCWPSASRVRCASTRCTNCRPTTSMSPAHSTTRRGGNDRGSRAGRRSSGRLTSWTLSSPPSGGRWRRCRPSWPTCRPKPCSLAQREGRAARNLQLTAAAERTAATEAAATTHRAATTTTAALDAEARAEADAAALRAMESTQRDRLAAAEWAVLALPPLLELERALTTAQELATARDAAERAPGPRRAGSRAGDGRAAGRRAGAAARRSISCVPLVTTVAALKPPAVSGGRLGASWQALLEWARTASGERSRRARAGRCESAPRVRR